MVGKTQILTVEQATLKRSDLPTENRVHRQRPEKKNCFPLRLGGVLATVRSFALRGTELKCE